MPGLRGKRSGVGPVFRSSRNPAGAASISAARSAAALPTAASTCNRLASYGSETTVSPGASTSAASQRSSRSLRNLLDDDVAVRLGAFAGRLHVLPLLEIDVDDLALDGRHRLERDVLARRACFAGSTIGELLQRGSPAVAVAGCIHDHALAVLVTPPHDRVGEVLDGVDRLTVLADHETEIRTRQHRHERFVVFP